jgi:dTDP-4-dehydrorhamnose 3,5-epimerase
LTKQGPTSLVPSAAQFVPVSSRIEVSVAMNVIPTRLPGVVVIEPKVYGDARGHFLETWNQARYAEAGLPRAFVQDNLSFSLPGVLRGLHFQSPGGQSKLVSVLSGAVFDVAVDIRRGSPEFGRWVGEVLSSDNRRQMFIPAGFAHGFVVLGDAGALFSYKVDGPYSPKDELTLAWNDLEIGIDWPVVTPILSAKDQEGLRLADIPVDRLPRYEPAAG